MTTSSQKDIINDILSAMQCYPENEAFIIDDKHYTYAQLGEITASITHSLSEIKDEKIGIVAENRIETYAAILAVLAGGKTYVILHPAYPEERNLKIAALAGLRTLLCTSDTDRSAFGTGHFRIIDTDRLPGKAQSEQQSHSSNEERNAYIIFTSGSTGEPKGVPITRANLNAFYRAYSLLDWNLDEHDRMLQMFELTFDVSVVSLLYPLTLGAAVYTVGHQDVKHFKVFELLEKYQLTFATVTPSLLQLLSPYFSEISGSIGRSIANRAVGAIQKIGTQRNVHQPIRTDRGYDLLHLLPYSGFGQMQALQRNGGYRKTISRHPRHHCRRRRKRATSRRDGRTLGIRPAGNERLSGRPGKIGIGSDTPSRRTNLLPDRRLVYSG